MARILIRRGFDRVSVLHGGFEEWAARGFPTQPRGPEWKVDAYPSSSESGDPPEAPLPIQSA